MEKKTEAGVQSDVPKISLAQWSFHKTLQDSSMTHLEFIKTAGSMGFTGVEYVSSFFKDHVTDMAYLDEMSAIAAASGVTQLLIMVDNEGYLADPDDLNRKKAVLNHYKWVDAAARLGCHSIRVNAHGEGSADQVKQAGVTGLSDLADYAAIKNINVIVENHGGYSSDGMWLSSLIQKVNKPNCGTLPDFGNFCLKRENNEMWNAPCLEWYDKYKGVSEMMPFAKAVSAKSYDFDVNGNETTIDYEKMLIIVKDAGYNGFMGVEYEGKNLDEPTGIKATKALIERYWK
jgi:sugar phosphate isomerase/epimerase